MDTIQTFKITGMHCVACTKLTAKRLRTIAGVSEATVDLASGRATIVTSQTVPFAEVQTVLAGGGYGAEPDND